MSGWLLVFALATQTADAAYTCRQMARTPGRELNPLVPNSCVGVVAVKSATFLPLLVLPTKGKKVYAISLGVAGGVGVSVSVALR